MVREEFECTAKPQIFSVFDKLAKSLACLGILLVNEAFSDKDLAY